MLGSDLDQPRASGAPLLDPSTFLFQLAQATIGADEGQSPRPVVLSIGVGNLQAIRDWFGREAGERLLDTVVNAAIDHVPAGAPIARMGSAEVGVLLTDPTEPEQVQALADKLHAAVTGDHRVEGRAVSVDATVGLAYGSPGIPVRELLAQADTAMYRARVTGVPVLTFEPTRPLSRQERTDLRDDLSQATDGDELLVHYQPVVELGSGRLVGLEALLRWNHPVRGILPAREILDAADSPALANSLTAWVLDQVHRDMLWIAPATDRPLTITINLSADNLADDGILGRLTSLVRDTPAPLTVVLDLPEATLAEADQATVDSVTSLHAAGARIAVDDFAGDGSTTGYLRRLPIHTLKLAPSLTRTVVSNPKTTSLVAGIASICDRLGLVLVAEAVEHRSQRDALLEAGCVLGQGWLYGTTVSGPEFASALALMTGED